MAADEPIRVRGLIPCIIDPTVFTMQISEGIMEPRSVSVDDKGVDVYGAAPWQTVAIFNDGPDSVYVSVNRGEQGELKAGESLTINFEKSKKKIELVHLICSEGKTANVRIFAKR